MHADRADILLMILGLIGAIGDGISVPVMLFITSKIMNNIGGSSTQTKEDDFTHNVNKVQFYSSLYTYIHTVSILYICI